MTHQDAENPRFVEWLNSNLVDPIAKYNWRQLKEDFEDQTPDFLADETASAILRDAMLAAGCHIKFLGGDGIELTLPNSSVCWTKHNLDPQAAILAAFLLFMQAKGGGGG